MKGLIARLEEIDLLIIQKALAELEESQRDQARKAKGLSVSKDHVVELHKDYWIRCEARHAAMAEVYKAMRQEFARCIAQEPTP